MAEPTRRTADIRLAEVRTLVDRMKQVAAEDPRTATELERNAWSTALQAIARGYPDPAMIAGAAMVSRSHPFTRQL
jgi:hypothetical protein